MHPRLSAGSPPWRGAAPAADPALRLAGWRGRLLALAAGLGAALGFLGDGFLLPRSVLAPATLIGLAALILLCHATPRRAPSLGWWWGFGHFAAGVHWIAEAFTYQAKMPAFLGWVCVAGLAAVLATMPAIACGLAFRLPRTPAARLWAFPAAWMLSEWIRIWLLTGFPWNPLAAITLFQYSPGLAPVAAVIGALGLSGVVALGAVGVAMLWRWHRLAGIGAGLVAIPALGVLANALAPVAPPARVPAVELVIVQPNIGQAVKWDPTAAPRQLATLIRHSTSGPPHRPGVPRLILWPEVALPQAVLAEDPELRALLARLLRPGDLLLLGGLSVEYGVDGQPVAAANSLLALDSGAQIVGRYDKFHLVPGGEYVPLRPLADALGLSRLAPGSLDFTPGPGPRTLALPGLPPVGPLICYEMIFPARIVDAGNRPAWLFNPSNDAWFGGSGPPQHLALARLRAIEEGLPVARSTPTGITALIGPDGSLRAALGQRVAGAVQADLPVAGLPTPFARVGHLASLPVALLCLGAAWGAARRRI